MVFDGRKLSELTEADLQRLVEDAVQERETIEYKSSMYGTSDDDNREMLKDVASMANHSGGCLIVGIDEDDEGTPTRVSGLPKDNHVERITSSCLSNIQKRIVGLQVEDVELASGNVVIVVSIPESLNAPHMVTYKGLNQFWRRHGRQKDKMTIDEIGQAFDRRLSDLNRLDRFLFMRKADILETIGQAPCMVISSTPTYLHNEQVFDIHDQQLRQTIANPPHTANVIGMPGISCGPPYPTINGLRADDNPPYHRNPPRPVESYIEVHRNGHMEYGLKMHPRNELGLLFSASFELAYLVDYVAFIHKLCSVYLPMTPLTLTFAVYNCKDMRLIISRCDYSGKWDRQHLELGKFYVDNLAEEADTLARRISDRFCQAFGIEKADVFDQNGKFCLPRLA